VAEEHCLKALCNICLEVESEAVPHKIHRMAVERKSIFVSRRPELARKLTVHSNISHWEVLPKAVAAHKCARLHLRYDKLDPGEETGCNNCLDTALEVASCHRLRMVEEERNISAH